MGRDGGGEISGVRQRCPLSLLARLWEHPNQPRTKLGQKHHCQGIEIRVRTQRAVLRSVLSAEVQPLILYGNQAQMGGSLQLIFDRIFDRQSVLLRASGHYRPIVFCLFRRCAKRNAAKPLTVPRRLNNRFRTRRRSAGAPPAAPRADLRRSGRVQPRAQPRHASRRRSRRPRRLARLARGGPR